MHTERQTADRLQSLGFTIQRIEPTAPTTIVFHVEGDDLSCVIRFVPINTDLAIENLTRHAFVKRQVRDPKKYVILARDGDMTLVRFGRKLTLAVWQGTSSYRRRDIQRRIARLTTAN